MANHTGRDDADEADASAKLEDPIIGSCRANELRLGGS